MKPKFHHDFITIYCIYARFNTLYIALAKQHIVVIFYLFSISIPSLDSHQTS
nr:MAG TPA_asm: hypothetical protein [Caudoviricetes sp.]